MTMPIDKRCWSVVVTKSSVGVLAIINHGHNRRHDEQRGFFGFFECLDDVEASNELFATAIAVAAGTKG